MGKKRRILMIRSNPVDPDPRVEKEANSLLGAGYCVDILCWDRESNYELKKQIMTMKNGYCSIYRVGIPASYGGGFRKNLKPLLKFQAAILRFVMKNAHSYDAIHACDFDTAFSVYMTSKLRRFSLVYDIFDYYVDAFSVPSCLRGVIEYLDSLIIKKANAVIICSEERIEQIGNVDLKKTFVIHNAPEYKVLSESTDAVADGPLRVAYVGILGEGRLIPELLDIVTELGSDFQLHIAGFGQYEALVRQYAAENDNIIFYGKTDYSRTLKIESSTDVMTALYDPSVSNHRYAAPNKVYEALMLGKPLIMCRGTGMSDIIDKFKFGICVDYSREGLFNGLVCLRDSINDYAERSMEEKELFTSNYSWNIMEKRLIDMYRELFREGCL